MNPINQLVMEELEQKIHAGLVSNEEIVQYIELLGTYLGLATIANKAKELNTDYNNVKCSAMPKVEIFGVKFVIDNE
jgi:hypothetical protein